MADLTLEGTAYESVGNLSSADLKTDSTSSTDSLVEKQDVKAQEETTAPSEEKKEVEGYKGPTEEEFNKFNFGDKKVATENKEPIKEEKPVEPEIKYDFKMPDNVDLSCDLMDKFKDVAKKHKLSNDDAQIYVDLVGQMINNEITAQKETIAKRFKEWQNELKTDPEIGGDKFAETHKYANLAIDKFGGNEFRKFLDLSGVGNNKVIAKFLLNVGKTISEDDTFINGSKSINFNKAKPARDSFGNPMLSFPSMDK